MADEQDVNAGSETSGDQAETETSQEETAATETAAETAGTSEATAENAGGAAEASTGEYVQDEDEEKAAEGETAAGPDADESRTGFVTNARPGDECICPDGRKGTVHSFDTGLVCIPNHDQGN